MLTGKCATYSDPASGVPLFLGCTYSLIRNTRTSTCGESVQITIVQLIALRITPFRQRCIYDLGGDEAQECERAENTKVVKEAKSARSQVLTTLRCEIVEEDCSKNVVFVRPGSPENYRGLQNVEAQCKWCKLHPTMPGEETLCKRVVNIGDPKEEERQRRVVHEIK